MSSKIGRELAQRMNKIREDASSDSVRVIVTVKSGTDRKTIESAGMTVENVLESVPAVSGSASTSVVEKLATMDEVELIEYDGDTYAV